AYSKEQDYVTSYDWFSRALQIAPNDYWNRLERAYFGRARSEEDTSKRVIPELEIAKAMRPDLPFASELLVGFYRSTRDSFGEKKELADQIERFGLDLLRAHDMAKLVQGEKNFDEAAAILRQVLQHDPGGRTAEQIGDSEYRMGHFAQARDWYRRAIAEGT